MRTLARDLGAGTVVAIGIIAAVLSVSGVLFAHTNRLVGQARLDGETDNAAIAAADALRGLVAGYPCDVAKELVPITSCVVQGNDVLIVTARNGLSARARAGEPG
ncbi:MAG: hypothetical protein RIS31_1037 [Actinomycetota bacterium]